MKRVVLLLIAMFIAFIGHSQDIIDLEEEQNQKSLQGTSTKQPRGNTGSNTDFYLLDGKLIVKFNEYIEDVINVSVTDCIWGEKYNLIEFRGCESIEIPIPNADGIYFIEIKLDSTVLCGYL